MSLLQTGRAVVYGIDGTVTFTGIAANVELMPQGFRYKHSFDLAELKDKKGEVIGASGVNDRYDATIEIIPIADGAGNTLVNAKAAVKLPAKLVKVTTAGMPNAEQNGDWLYIGDAEMSLTNDGFPKMTLPVRKYSTDLTTAVPAGA